MARFERQSHRPHIVKSGGSVKFEPGRRGVRGPSGPGAATQRLAEYRAHPAGDLTVAVVGTTSWARAWATDYAAGLPSSVQALHVAGGTTTVLRPGSGTPPSGGALVQDDLTGSGALNGRTPTKGAAWVAATGWTLSGGKATTDSGGASLDATVGDDIDAHFDLAVTTTSTGAVQTWRFYIATATPSATGSLTNGLWANLSINAAGGLASMSLWKTVGGTSTQLTTGTITGISSNSSTPQALRATLTRRAGQFTVTLTNGATTHGTASTPVTSADVSGTRVGIQAFAGATGFALDRIEAGTPYIPGTSATTLTITEVPGTSSLPSRLPNPLDVALVDADASAADTVRAARTSALVQVVTGADVPALTMPSALAERVAAIESSPAPGAALSALEPLRTLHDFGAGEVAVAVVSDSTANDRNDWARIWALKWGAALPGRVRRTYRDWDATTNTWRTQLVDNAGAAPDAGVVVDDDFSTAGTVAGSTPDTGPAWSGTAAGWSSDGSIATVTGSAGKVIAQNLGSSDQTVRVTLSMVTTGQAAAQLFRVYAGSQGSGLYHGVWASLSLNTSGGLTVGLYVTTSTTTTLAASVPIAGVSSNSSTPQPVTVEVTTAIQQAAVKVTAAGQTTTLTGTVPEDQVSNLGQWAGVLGSPNDAFTYGYRLDAIHMHTPAADNPTASPTLAVHNAAIAGGGLTTHFGPAARALMFGVLDVDVLILAMGHNNGTQTPAAFTAEVGAWLTAWKAEHPNSAVLIASQNPQVAPSSGIVTHRDRQAALRGWAKARGYDYLPIFETFAARPDGGASLIGPDGVHPTTTTTGTLTGDFGAILWADTAVTVLDQ